jgi:predicted DNA-binding mobile mystery protein A
VREALGMSTSEMATRMGVSQARISQLERAELEGSVRLSTLERAAQALNCQVHYVVVPNEPLEDMVRRQARDRAAADVAATTHTMRLEDQAPDAQVIADEIDALAERLVDTSGLWRPEPRAAHRPA